MANEARITIRDLPRQLSGDEMRRVQGGYPQVPLGWRNLPPDTWSGTWPGLQPAPEPKPVCQTR